MKKYLVKVIFPLVVILTTVAACKKKPQLDIPDTFNPSTYTKYYSYIGYNGVQNTTWFPPLIDLGITGNLVGTTYVNGYAYPAIFTYSNVTFTGDFEMKNQFFLVRKPVMQSFQVTNCYVNGYFTPSYQFNQGDTLSFLYNTTLLQPWFNTFPWSNNVSSLSIGDSIDILKFVVNNGNQDLPMMQNSASNHGENYSDGVNPPTQVISNTFRTPAIPAQGIVALHIKSPYLGPSQYQISVNLDTNKAINAQWKGTTSSTDNVTGFLH
jgi:hypothetical protein